MANDLILVESATRRNEVMEGVAGDEKALEAMNKAKALTMAMWQGQAVATSEQLAEFYGVPGETLRTVFRRNREEFQSDGVKVARGKKAISELCFIMKQSSNTPSLTLWTPRAALRLGMLLRDSEVAKQVRSLLLDIAQSANPTKPTPAPRLRAAEEASLADAMLLAEFAVKAHEAAGVNPAICASLKIQTLKILKPRLEGIDEFVATHTKAIQLSNPIPGGLAPMTPTQLSQRLNKELGLDLRAYHVNLALKELEFQERQGKGWQLTEAGQQFATPYAATNANTGWSGPQILWNGNVLPELKQYYAAVEAAQ